MGNKYEYKPTHKGYQTAIRYFCDMCGKEVWESRATYKKKKRHFCSTNCYATYRAEKLPKEEHAHFGKGLPPEERKVRMKSRSDTGHAIRDGKLKTQACKICGKKAQTHHKDYKNPLDVEWLCFEHHRLLHKTTRTFRGLN